MKGNFLVPTARILIAAWALWWSFFAIAESVSEAGPLTGKLLRVAGVLVVLWGSAVIVWRWELIGALLLLVEALFVFGCYPTGLLHAQSTTSMAFVLGTLATPPLIAGLLLLIDWWQKHPKPAH